MTLPVGLAERFGHLDSPSMSLMTIDLNLTDKQAIIYNPSKMNLARKMAGLNGIWREDV